MEEFTEVWTLLNCEFSAKRQQQIGDNFKKNATEFAECSWCFVSLKYNFPHEQIIYILLSKRVY